MEFAGRAPLGVAVNTGDSRRRGDFVCVYFVLMVCVFDVYAEGMHTTDCLCRVEDNFGELDLFLLHHVRSCRDWTKNLRVGGKCLYMLSRFVGPLNLHILK